MTFYKFVKFDMTAKKHKNIEEGNEYRHKLGKSRFSFSRAHCKDLIITGGENVYPREIEELLYTRPEVQECAVIGLPDREYGERIMAIIVP